jgi:hypothetical protein
MDSHRHPWIIAFAGLFLSLPMALAQGTLEDYVRAERFLPGNVRHLAYIADVTPHWIEKSNRFWYLRVGLDGKDFVMVDAEKNTSAPAFDQGRLAGSLSHAAKQEYSATTLPFSDFDFVEDGKAIHFSIGDAQWICSLMNAILTSLRRPSRMKSGRRINAGLHSSKITTYICATP